MAPNHTTSCTHNDKQDELVYAAGHNKPSLVRSILASAPAARVEAAWPAAVAAAAAASEGGAYVMEILLQHQPQHPQEAVVLQDALLVASEKDHAGVVALLLRERPRPFYPRRVIEAAVARALRGDHAGVLQALLDRAKPDPYVRLVAEDDDGDNDGQTPIEMATAQGSQRCAALLKAYESVWRQRTMQLISAALVDTCRLLTLPNAVIENVLLECLAGRRGEAEAAPSIQEPARKRGLEEDEDEEEEEGDGVDEQDFPPVRFLQQRGRKRRKSAGGGKKHSPRRHSGGQKQQQGVVVLTLTTRRMLRPRKAKTWSEMREMPLPSDSFSGACAF